MDCTVKKNNGLFWSISHDNQQVGLVRPQVAVCFFAAIDVTGVMVWECLANVWPTDSVLFMARKPVDGSRPKGGRTRGTWPRPEGNHRLPWAAHLHSE